MISTHSLCTIRLDALMVSLSTEYTDAFNTGDRLKSVETFPSSDAFFYPSSDELFLYR